MNQTEEEDNNSDESECEEEDNNIDELDSDEDQHAGEEEEKEFASNYESDAEDEQISRPNRTLFHCKEPKCKPILNLLIDNFLHIHHQSSTY